MRAAAALSEHPLAAHAVGEIAGSIMEQLTEPIDVAIVFVEASHTGAIEDVASAVHELLTPAVLVGSTACGVLAQDTEVEDRGAMSIWAASGVQATGFRIGAGEEAPPGGWQQFVEQSDPGDDARAVALVDPYSIPVDELLSSAAGVVPPLRIHGGLASAARGPGGNRLLLDGQVFSDGAVGVSLSGPTMTSVVSQGCRPIGRPMIVTGVTGNVITELASEAPMNKLRRLAEAVDDHDRALMAYGIHIGIALDETIEELGRGDFLIRGVIGADAETGAIAVGAEVPLGSTVQFHVRDAATASEDLTDLLSGRHAGAALTFTCNGRGVRLFGVPDHDAELVHRLTGSQATAGMFCAGELGPVSGVNHLHGFTASSLLFSAPDD